MLLRASVGQALCCARAIGSHSNGSLGSTGSNGWFGGNSGVGEVARGGSIGSGGDDGGSGWDGGSDGDGGGDWVGGSYRADGGRRSGGGADCSNRRTGTFVGCNGNCFRGRQWSLLAVLRKVYVTIVFNVITVQGNIEIIFNVRNGVVGSIRVK